MTPGATRSATTLAAALAAASVVACAHVATPGDVVRDYAAAVAHDKPAAAWDLAAPQVQAATSRERHDAEFQRRVDAGDRYVESLRAAADEPVTLSAELHYSELETLTLAVVDGQWRITGGVANATPQATPRAALAAFARAVEARDPVALRRLVPSELRAQIRDEDLLSWLDRAGPELADTLALIRASADAPIRENGDTATFRYGSRTMRFVREDGLWMIEDFE